MAGWRIVVLVLFCFCEISYYEGKYMVHGRKDGTKDRKSKTWGYNTVRIHDAHIESASYRHLSAL
jgi:hypothetical protein